ncbi:MAG: argininosuccinate lyase, partial [Prevotellaceae bacterium]|nr:argininosuccinate lyase [Prevotellaceae bacterium]
DAYKKVGMDIEKGQFIANKDIHHTHEGSIGNLMNDKITALMDKCMAEFHFEKVEEAEKALLA